MNADEVVMFRLDDDDIITDLDHNAWVSDSFVGTVSQTHESLEESVRHEDDALAEAVTRLESTCNAFDSVDVSAAAAQLSLRRRVGGLRLLSDALVNVCGFVLSPDHRELFGPAGLLGPYLSCVHMWVGDVTETLTHLATELNVLAPSWSAFRECLTNVEWIHERAMAEQRRLAAVADTLPADVRAATGELFIAFIRFKHTLDEPFG